MWHVLVRARLVRYRFRLFQLPPPPHLPLEDKRLSLTPNIQHLQQQQQDNAKTNRCKYTRDDETMCRPAQTRQFDNPPFFPEPTETRRSDRRVLPKENGVTIILFDGFISFVRGLLRLFVWPAAGKFCMHTL